ncbi:MAG TPA: hypothetical protein VF531_06850 [Bacillota bacterium]
MRTPKSILGIGIMVISLVIGGCSLFPSNQTRPAPVRPRATVSPRSSPAPLGPIATRGPKTTIKGKKPTTKVRPAPVRTPGLSSVTDQHLVNRLVTINNAVTKNNWTVANREVNTLGTDMARFRPTRSKAKTLRDMASFDTIYVKLQADVKAKNKTAAMQDVKNMQNALRDLKKSPTSPSSR